MTGNILGRVAGLALLIDGTAGFKRGGHVALGKRLPALRKRTGSYHTPPEVVAAMVSVVDEAPRSPSLFARSAGLASSDVTKVDPATGTGPLLLGTHVAELRGFLQIVDASAPDHPRPPVRAAYECRATD